MRRGITECQFTISRRFMAGDRSTVREGDREGSPSDKIEWFWFGPVFYILVSLFCVGFSFFFGTLSVQLFSFFRFWVKPCIFKHFGPNKPFWQSCLFRCLLRFRIFVIQSLTRLYGFWTIRFVSIECLSGFCDKDNDKMSRINQSTNYERFFLERIPILFST